MFRISTSGAFTSLYSFTGGTDGWSPQAGLAQASDGNFYGTTTWGGTNGYGAVFKTSRNGGHAVLYSFKLGSDGANPEAALVQADDGYFYGSTTVAGTLGLGTIFRISTDGELTTLYSFTGGNDGASPGSPLVQGSDGYLYGMTLTGGTNGYGNVFKISTNGVMATLYEFADGEDGANPRGGLMLGSDGNFYGTTSRAGAWGWGTVFRLSLGLAAPITQAITLANGAVTVTWSAAPGASYQIEFTTDLISGTWSNLGSVLTTTGATLSATDSVTNGPVRFYRVVLLP